MRSGDRPAGLWTAAVATALFAAMVLWLLSAGFESIDDAYISLRYADNLVSGQGLVYNPGEPVQGYTNFLWVMLLAAALAAGLPALEAAAVVGGLAGAATVALTALWSARRVAPGRASAAAAPVLLASNLGLAVWSIRGLETGMFTLLVLAGGLLYLRRGPYAPLPAASGLALGLATLTRPEGGLALALTIAHAGLCRAVARRPLVTRRDVPALAAYGLLVGAWAGWAWAYYGDPLPNTLRAKVGGPLESLPRGWDYLWNRFGRYGTGWPLLLLPLALLPRRRPDATRTYCAVIVLGFGVYIAMVGGDVFPAYRFLVPVLPFLYLLVGDALAGLEERVTPPLAARGLAAGLLIVLALATFRPSSAFAWREWRGGNRYTADMRMVGRWLGEFLPPDAVIAVNPAGALPYEAGLRTIDMLGLTDREIALTPVAGLGSGRLAGHEKGNGASVLRRRPDVILIGGVKLEPFPARRQWKPHGRSERELAAHPDLYVHYRLQQERMPDGRVLTFLRRR